MNEDLGLRNRLANADPGRAAATLNEGIVAKAALSKAKRFSSFKVARLSMTAASLSIVGLAVAGLAIPQGSPEPLFTLAQSGSQNTSAMAAGAESTSLDGKIAADSMMIWPGYRYNYIAGELSTETGRGKVFQAELVGDPEEILGNLAAYFGVSGEPKRDEWATDEFPSYSIQTETTSLGIYFSGTGNWYYSSWNNAAFSCSVTSSDEGEGQEYCEPQPTPELIPAEAELLSQASELFDGLGIAVDSSAARVWRDDWGASVSFPNIQMGINTGMDYYVGWGMDGKINYAAGYSFRLIERGEFDTVSAMDSVARISDGRWMGAAPSSYYENLAVAYDSAVSSPMARETTTEIAVEEPAAEGDGTAVVKPEPADEPGSGFEYLEPEVVDLKVVRSEAVTLSVFDAAGNYWYVPGYLLYNEQGWFDSIISLEEGVIELPEPFTYDVMPLEEPQG